MTAITHSPQRDASQTPAYRIAALLFGVGTLHFVAPKPFDEHHPRRTARQPRGSTPTRPASLSSSSAPCCCRCRPGGWRRWRRPRLFLAVFPANVNMCRLWWDKPWPMRILALARLPLQIPMITTALKIARNS